MQLSTFTQKLMMFTAATGYLAGGILLFHPGDRILDILGGINNLQNHDVASASSFPAFTPNVWEESDAEDLPVLRFAVIGDYGTGGQAEADVAARIKSWIPEFIITTGDNNYPDGEASTIDRNIGQFFHEFIYPYQGGSGDGAQENRFFPSLGNHDWYAEDAQPYLDYFALPGNERYYEFIWGPIHFFVLDSDTHEPHGADINSSQAAWLQTQLAVSDSPWKIVYMHHPPFSSGTHGSIERMQWPYAEWGADVVISGHDHTYERIFRDGITYFVNGLGGKSKYPFFSSVDGSQVRYNQDYGAMLVEASEIKIRFQFINRHGELIDVKDLIHFTSSLYLPMIHGQP